MIGSATATPAEVGTAGEVLGLLREQASMYGRLETLATRQQLLVSVEDAGPLLALLADRQKLAEGLTGIASRLEPVRCGWRVYRERFSETERVEADRLWDDVRQRLRRIIERDEQDARVLSARRQSVRQALQTAHATGQALSAYRAPSVGANRLDCVDEVCR